MKSETEPIRPMTVVERAVALRKVEAFRAVPIDQLAHVATVAREESLPAGSVLFREGDPPDSLFVMLDGKIRLLRGGRPFGEAVAGEPLGTWSLFIDHPRRATAEVVENTRVLVLDREEFYEVLAEQVEVTRSMVQDLVSRLLELAGLTEEGSA
jgi:CRP-like cAMP-binding protein